MSTTTTLHDMPQEILGIILDYACTENENYGPIILTCKLWKELIEKYHTFKRISFFGSSNWTPTDFGTAFDVLLNSNRKYKLLDINLDSRSIFLMEQIEAGTRLSKSTVKTVHLKTQDEGFQISFLDFKNLIHFKNLQVLKITFPGTPFIRYMSYGTEIMELENLKKIQIEFKSTMKEVDPAIRYLMGVKFLNHINTPQLEDLSINFKAFYPEGSLPFVYDFLSKNSLHLNKVLLIFLNTELLFWTKKCLRINTYDSDVKLTNFLADKIAELEVFHLLNLYDLNLLKIVLGRGHRIKRFTTNIDLMHLLDEMPFFQIESLTLMRSHFEIESLFKLSQNFPNVEDLCFRFSTLDQNLKEELSQIFPKLKNVSYE